MTTRLGLAISAALLEALLLTAQGKDFRPVTEASRCATRCPVTGLNWRRTDNGATARSIRSTSRTSSNAAGMVVVDGRQRAQGSGTARPRWRDVSAQSARRDPGARRGKRRPDLGIPSRHNAGPLRHQDGGGEQRTSLVSLSVPQAAAPIWAAAFRNTRDLRRQDLRNDERGIIALNARTGKVVWDVTTADEKLDTTYRRSDRRAAR